jgi:hypothetical protein
MRSDRDESFGSWVASTVHPRSSIFNSILAISIVFTVIILVLYFISVFLRLNLPSPFLLLFIFFIIFFVAVFIYLRLRWKTSRIINIKLEKNIAKPGERVSGYLELRVDKPLKINGVTARFWGGERVEVVVSHGKHSTTYVEKRVIIDEAVELEPQGLAAALPKTYSEAKELSRGNYLYGFSVVVPRGALQSWNGWQCPSLSDGKDKSMGSSFPADSRVIGVSYYIQIYLDVKERIDAKKIREIVVRPVPMKPTRKPCNFSTQHAVQDPTRPSIHVDLDSGETKLNDKLSGKVMLRNPKGKRVRKIKVSLVEKVWGIAQGNAQTYVNILAETEVKVLDEKGGGYMPFILRVPANARSTVYGKISAIFHTIIVKADIAFARDVKAEGRVLVVPE